MQDVYDAHRKDGLEILDFPCNQFGEQAPGDDEEIHSFCTGRFGITFPQFSKIDVGGENAIPLYRYLTANTTFAGFNGPMSLILKPVVKKKVGKVVGFSTAALIKSTRKQVAKLLAAKNIPFAEEEFACKGSFAMLHRGKPDVDDCKAAAAFAKKIVS